MISKRYMKGNEAEFDRWIVYRAKSGGNTWLASFASEFDADHYIEQLDSE